MPRLKLPIEIKRSCHVLVTLTLNEKRLLEQIKEQRGKSYSTTLRDALLLAYPTKNPSDQL